MSEDKIFVVDDNTSARSSLRALLESAGYEVLDYASAMEFLEQDESLGSCLIADVRMPEMTGMDLHEMLVKRGSKLPVIFITGYGSVPLTVRAMNAGAIDFLEKPFDDETLLESLKKALGIARKEREISKEAASANELISQLTPRELEVLEQLVAGRSSKLVASELNISPRTVEVHRAHIKNKLHARCLSDLVRTALAASKRSSTNLRGQTT
jgi:two-component system response regulator FixJ